MAELLQEVVNNTMGYDDVKLASSGRIDSLIVDMAKENNATLYTSDHVQYLVAQAEGVETVFLKSLKEKSNIIVNWITGVSDIFFPC